VECRIATPTLVTPADAANGTFQFTVYRKETSAQLFLDLVAKGYYDGTYIFRVIKGFVCQWSFRREMNKFKSDMQTHQRSKN
jgi:cyclophilin family peptidyl-prolyl cis-trans isomerase